MKKTLIAIIAIAVILSGCDLPDLKSKAYHDERWFDIRHDDFIHEMQSDSIMFKKPQSDSH